MKKIFFPIIVAFLMPPLFTTAQERKHHERTEREEKVVQLVISSCLGILQNAVQIGQDPHNKQNVGANVGQIIHNIAEVVTQATQRLKELDVSPEEFMDICKRRVLIEQL